jgi:hypothetical protein
MRPGLIKEVVGQLKNGCSTTSYSSKLDFDLSKELPSSCIISCRLEETFYTQGTNFYQG